MKVDKALRFYEDFNRCPSCRGYLTSVCSDHYMCINKECNVEDGVYQDKRNLLGFGKDEYVVHIPTQRRFMHEVRYVQDRIQERNTVWQNQYYHTFDYKFIQKVKSLFSSLKERFINKGQLIYNYDDEKNDNKK